MPPLMTVGSTPPASSSAADGGGGDDHRRAFDVLRLVADHHRNAALAQTFDDVAFGDVRTLHRIAHVVHDFGNAGHADATDAHEMDRADVCADALHARAPTLRACFDRLSTSGFG